MACRILESVAPDAGTLRRLAETPPALQTEAEKAMTELLRTYMNLVCDITRHQMTAEERAASAARRAQMAERIQGENIPLARKYDTFVQYCLSLRPDLTPLRIAEQCAPLAELPKMLSEVYHAIRLLALTPPDQWDARERRTASAVASYARTLCGPTASSREEPINGINGEWLCPSDNGCPLFGGWIRYSRSPTGGWTLTCGDGQPPPSE